MQLKGSPIGFPIGNIEAYINSINQIPMLSVEEERECARRFREEGDLEGARTLVLAHLRYVVHVARGYLGYGLPLGDLIQEGSVGLMKAVKRFDPSMGVRLVSFAVHWIKAEIHEFVIQNWRIVKVATTKAQRKLFFNMRKMKHGLEAMNQAEAQAMAQELGVSQKDVAIMEERLMAADTDFDVTPEDYLKGAHADPARLLEEEDSNTQYQEKLHMALAQLDPRSQDILRQRWLQDDAVAPTLHDLAAKYAVSAERIRQLEKNAIKKLRHFIAD